MYSTIIFLSLINLTLSLVPFQLNPNCTHILCNDTNRDNVYYSSTTINNTLKHMIFSTFDDLTISIFETNLNEIVQIDYDALFRRDYEHALKINNEFHPTNAFSIVIPRLIEFNDENDTATIGNDSATTISYYLADLTYDNLTETETETYQPTFRFDLQNLTGNLTISIKYPGETVRDSDFPKLRVEPSSFFLNIALQTSNCTYDSSRFALEMFIMSPSDKPFSTQTESYIDDQYTPGIFNVWQLKTTEMDLYPSSMLWKPVVYQSDARSVEENTLMRVYPIQNQIPWSQAQYKGMFLSITSKPTIAAFNVSFGSEGDDFFSKTNYAFVQFAAGLDQLEPDSVALFVTIAAIISFAPPVLVGIIAIIFMIRRKLTKDSTEPTRFIN